MHRGRMTKPGDQINDQHEEKPRGVNQNRENGEGYRHPSVKQVTPARKQGIDDVSSVQLTHGQQVESGDEQSRPSRRGHRMKLEAAAIRQRSVNPFDQEIKENRVSQQGLSLIHI